jgi:NAD(P)-dependent dehydrogenase (short-subunit alcohol dehydrogenase family)
MNLSQKVVVVTGAASGIGAAIVDLFLESDAHVVAVDIDPQLETLPARIGKDKALRLRVVVGDVAQEETAQRYVKVALEAFHRIDVMINNAGVAVIRKIADLSPDEWDRVMNINVKSIYWSARHVIPEMKKAGGGLILNTGSISSFCAIPEQGVYGPSKGAVAQLTRTMAIDYAADNIRVNAVCPGTVDTPLLQKAAVDSGDPEKFLNGLASAHPIGRISNAREMAYFYRFLASDEAKFFTGANLMIDGGFSAQ